MNEKYTYLRCGERHFYVNTMNIERRESLFHRIDSIKLSLMPSENKRGANNDIARLPINGRRAFSRFPNHAFQDETPSTTINNRKSVDFILSTIVDNRETIVLVSSTTVDNASTTVFGLLTTVDDASTTVLLLSTIVDNAKTTV